jgi:hypothetical protein
MIGQVILDFVKQSAKLKSISKADIIDILELNITTHKNIDFGIKSMTPTQTKELFRRYVSNKDMYKKLISKEIPIDIPKGLRNNARDLDSKNVLSAYMHTNKMFIKIQEDILKNIDKIMVEKELTIMNTRLGFVSLLGILRQSETYGCYFSYLLDQIFTISNKKGSDIPGYRSKYLVVNKELFIDITNTICDKKGTYSFLNEMDDLKRKNANLLLYANGNTVDMFAKSSNYTSSVLSYLKSGLYALNIFLWVGEIVDDYKHNRYLKNKHIKEWLESHVANLRYDLADKDPDSPEALKLQKIIDAHDSKIVEFDRKISKYLDED